jgi:hypothetical protein
MSDSPEDEAFRLFQRLEAAAKALDKTANALNGVITGDVITALKSAQSATADAAKQLAAANTTTTNLGTQITSARELVDAAKQNVEALPAYQSIVMFIGIVLGISLAGSILYASETLWPSSSRESIQNAVLTRIAATTETCQNARALLGTAAIWVKNNEGRRIVACGFTIINQPPPTPDPEPAPTPQNPRQK